MLLDSLRQRRTNVIIYAVFGIIIFTFILWGGYGKEGRRGGSVIPVGEIEIDIDEFHNEFEMMKNHYQSMLANQPMNEQMMEFLKRMTLNNLVRQKLLYRAAQNMKVPCSRYEIAKVIQEQGAFRDPKTGAFDKEGYMGYLRYMSLTPQRFEDKMKMTITAEKLKTIMKLPIEVTPEEAERLFEIENTTIDVDYVTVDPARDFQNLKISEERLRVEYEKNRASFQTEEKRKLQYVGLTPDVSKKAVSVSEGEMRDYYKKEIEGAAEAKKKSLMEKRAWAEHILIDAKNSKDPADKAKAKAKALDILAKARKNPGDFARLAREFSEDPSAVQNGGSLGYFSFSQMVKPFSEAIFASKPGSIIGPVETNFGYHIIKVNDVLNQEGISFEKFRSEIGYILREQKGELQQKEMFSEVEKMLGATKQGDAAETLKMVAKRFSVPVGESGFFGKDGVIEGVPDSFSLVQEAFRLSEKQVSKLIRQGSRGYVIAVVATQKPTPMTFDEARGMITKKLMRDVLAEHLKKLLEEANSRKQAGEAFAAQYKLKRETTGAFKQYGEDSIPKIGTADALMEAISAMETEKRFYGEPVWHKNQFYLLYAKAIKRPDIAEFLKKPGDQLEKLRQEKELSVVISLSKALEKKYQVTPDVISRIAL